jgi:hypothetical protein
MPAAPASWGDVMVDTLGGLIVYAVGVAVSSLPILAAVAMIGSEGGMRLGCPVAGRFTRLARTL